MTGADIDKCPSMDLLVVMIPEWQRKDQPITVYEFLRRNASRAQNDTKMLSGTAQNDRTRLRHKTKCNGACFWFFNTTKMAHAFVMLC
jgi:hypothetical protein